MANAPQCFISVNEVINQPPGVKLPAIPQANDLASALQAIDAMRQMLNLLTGQTRQSANQGRPGQQGPGGQPGKNNENKVPRWTVTNEAKQDVIIPIDTSGDVPQVTISRINSLTIKDSITGQTIQLNFGSA